MVQMVHSSCTDTAVNINELGEKADYAGLEQILSAIDTARARLEANVNLELVMELLFLTMKNPS